MAKDFNHPQVVDGYDEHIRKLIPGYELIHLQVHALLESYLNIQKVLNPHILIVGCGTGYELLKFAEHYPDWSFTAIDPALKMIEKVQKQVEQFGLSERVQLLVGDTTVLKTYTEKFDIALAILVSHFVPTPNKVDFFQEITDTLKVGGLCLSVDLTEIKTEQELLCLKLMVIKTGLAEKQSQAMIDRIGQDFYLISLEDVFKTYQQVGLTQVKSFTQILNYYGFVGFKG